MIPEQRASTIVTIPTSSDVKDVRTFAQDAARASFLFFMTSVLERPADVAICEFLQKEAGGPCVVVLAAHEIRRYAEAFILWTAIRDAPAAVAVVGVDVRLDPSAAQNETFRWLFPRQDVHVRASRVDVVFVARARVAMLDTRAA